MERPVEIIIGFLNSATDLIKGIRSLSPDAILKIGWIGFSCLADSISNAVEKKINPLSRARMFNSVTFSRLN